MKKKALIIGLAICIFWLGCAGREGNPVQTRQFGDDQKSCKQLRAELFYVESELERLVPGSSKTGRNVALGATGIFFIVPLFFIDAKQGAKKEIRAYKQRYNYLLMLAQQKECKISEIATGAEETNEKIVYTVTSDDTPKSQPARDAATDSREPRALATAESNTHTQPRSSIVIKGIVWSTSRPAVLIGGQIIREGGSVSGARVVKIRKDSVEFEKDGTTWRQGVSK